MPEVHKIVFAGAMGAGKTTAIAAVSECPVVSTDVANSDRAQADKATTTVAMDFGQVALDNGDALHLYGTPGQARFDFMWDIAVTGAVGLVLLADNSRPDPLADLAGYLDAFGARLGDTAAIVGVGRSESHPQPSLDAYFDLLEGRGLSLPVFAVDVRRRDDVLLLLDALFHQIEAMADTDEGAFR
ncbi:GTP-binding protein [Coralloluteibacterium stylophorae]|uniref:ATP/GTP-binding protein n=1 Tax=Coralloluteibacterium stylophorae TaxID=1776034 RepID=A0A8J8AXT2_9GAMM|nr:ATP/GTP-binding protein [Coralloluteibacterium stylophorae]MBS7459030.1 ATP/GTP-binding protein [Coralloluteibacterium stylophorae]